MSNIERVSRERVEQMIHDAREMALDKIGTARFLERERKRHGERELRERGENVNNR